MLFEELVAVYFFSSLLRLVLLLSWDLWFFLRLDSLRDLRVFLRVVLCRPMVVVWALFLRLDKDFDP